MSPSTPSTNVRLASGARHAAAVAVVAILVSSAAADTVTLRSVRDNTLIETSDGSLSNGAGDGVYSGRTSMSEGSLRRAVLAFLEQPSDLDVERGVSREEQGIGPELAEHFVEAALMLVDREIDLIGIDTASLDNGLSTGFRAHRVLNGANIPGLENVANLDHLPPTGATVVALPMKIERGTGGPCRIIAILP